jgi:endonuclease-3
MVEVVEGVYNQGKLSPENELSNVKKCTTKAKVSRRRHVSVALEDDVDNEPVQKEGTKHSSSETRDSENKKSKWEPKNWHEVVNNIREMRKQRDAPVDSMGCDKCADESAPPEVNVDYYRCIVC